MRKKDQQQLKEIRYLYSTGASDTQVAKKLKVTPAGLPHRVLSLFRKECQVVNEDEWYDQTQH